MMRRRESSVAADVCKFCFISKRYTPVRLSRRARSLARSIARAFASAATISKVKSSPVCALCSARPAFANAFTRDARASRWTATRPARATTPGTRPATR